MVHQLNKVKILFSQEVLLNCPNGAGEEVKKVKSANLDRDGWTQCMKADLQNKYNYLQLSQTKKKRQKKTHGHGRKHIDKYLTIVYIINCSCSLIVKS